MVRKSNFFDVEWRQRKLHHALWFPKWQLSHIVKMAFVEMRVVTSGLSRVVAFQKVFEFELVSIFFSRPKVTMTTGQTTSELMWKDGWTSSSRRWKISGKTSAKFRIMWRKLNANTVLFYPHHKRMKVRLLCSVSRSSLRPPVRSRVLLWAAAVIVKARKWKPLFAATSAVPQEV